MYPQQPFAMVACSTVELAELGLLTSGTIPVITLYVPCHTNLIGIPTLKFCLYLGGQQWIRVNASCYNEGGRIGTVITPSNGPGEYV